MMRIGMAGSMFRASFATSIPEVPGRFLSITRMEYCSRSSLSRASSPLSESTPSKPSCSITFPRILSTAISSSTMSARRCSAPGLSAGTGGALGRTRLRGNFTLKPVASRPLPSISSSCRSIVRMEAS